MKPAVDPHCLCGKPHPCPQHGDWVGEPYQPSWSPRSTLEKIGDTLQYEMGGFDTEEVA